ncbi:hypothetical protein PF011_g20085 [Phytophthora fragariae]|uniref:Pectate lyase n=1 Tax=Phytophthora fragariae TaxID=53985 RepID=A0A6A3J0Y6_9STRA|nr:hypothetical protein PF011_g20085 [Phytophthora fragariae]
MTLLLVGTLTACRQAGGQTCEAPVANASSGQRLKAIANSTYRSIPGTGIYVSWHGLAAAPDFRAG